MCPLPRIISMVNGTNSMTPGSVKVTTTILLYNQNLQIIIIKLSRQEAVNK